MDEENGKSGEQAASTIRQMLSFIGKLIKDSFKVVGKFFKWIGTSLAAIMPYILIGILIIVAVLGVIAAIDLIISAAFDSIKGLMSSLGGVSGDKFYGTRYVYYDDEYTSQDLKNIYLDFTYEIIKDVYDTSTYKINIDYTKTGEENQEIVSICYDFVTKLVTVENIPANKKDAIIACSKEINNYGFTTEQSDIVLRSLRDSTIDNCPSGTSSEGLLTAFKNSYDSQNFSYMKNVCAKILIKDYIVNGDETAVDIPKKNYVGFVYMPKEQTIIKNASFVFAIENDNTVEITANYKNQEIFDHIKSETADSTWFKNGSMEKSFECDLSGFIFNKFTAIDENNLNYFAEPKTIFDVCKDSRFNIYFKETADKQNIGSLLENINTNNYFYLKLNSNAPYNMAESLVEYE